MTFSDMNIFDLDSSKCFSLFEKICIEREKLISAAITRKRRHGLEEISYSSKTIIALLSFSMNQELHKTISK